MLLLFFRTENLTMFLEFYYSELYVATKSIYKYRVLSHIPSCHTRFMQGTATLYKYGHTRLAKKTIYNRQITQC